MADRLRAALAMYTESGGTGAPSIDTAQAIAIMLEKYEVACDILHGFDWPPMNHPSKPWATTN